VHQYVTSPHQGPASRERWCTHRHRFTRYHHITEAPSFATFKQAFAVVFLCFNRKDREIDRLVSGRSKHGCTAYRGTTGICHRGRDIAT